MQNLQNSNFTANKKSRNGPRKMLDFKNFGKQTNSILYIKMHTVFNKCIANLDKSKSMV